MILLDRDPLLGLIVFLLLITRIVLFGVNKIILVLKYWSWNLCVCMLFMENIMHFCIFI